MSKKPKKSKLKKKNNKAAKRNKNVAALAYKGVITRVMRTHGFVCQTGGDSEHFVSGRDLLGAIPGDVVLFQKTGRRRDEESLPEAKVVKVLKEGTGVLTGTVVEDNGVLAIVPDSFGSRYGLKWGSAPNPVARAGEPCLSLPKDGASPQTPLATPKVGDKVKFRLSSRGDKHHLHVPEITGVYGSAQSARVCVNAYLEEKGIATAFAAETQEQAYACGSDIDSAEIPGRLDLRDAPIFTIDGSDTKDIDDAISIERTECGYRLAVHIADVSHYVTPDTPLDAEAFERGTSVYIADMVVPMLPPQLSNGICSLNPNVDRLAFSCIMELAKSGELKAFEFKKTVIRSRVQGVYSEINALLAKPIPARDTEFGGKYDEVLPQLPIMLELAVTLKKNREGRGAPALESAECKIICGEDGGVLDIKRRESGQDALSEGIIEEFMLLANNAAARLAMERELPFVYRVHEPPAVEKLERLSQTLAGLGIDAGELKPTAQCLCDVLKAVKVGNFRDVDRYDVVNMAVLRAMMKAKYSDEPLGHFGLVMSEYAHFTSPIRRYPDLSIHRILSDYVKSGAKAGTGALLLKKYGRFAHQSAVNSTNTELRAVTAERDCNRFYFAEYMSSRVGEEFCGSISGITEMSLFVLLENTVEGRVLLNVNGRGDGFVRSADGVTLANDVTGIGYTLGERVKVKCVGCSVPLGTVDFEIVT